MNTKKLAHIFQSILYSLIYIAIIYIIITFLLGKYVNAFWSYVNIISTDSDTSYSNELEMGVNGLKMRPEYGKQYGEIKISSVNINLPLYFGDSLNELKNGIGQSARSFCPGEGKTIILTGHNTDIRLKKIHELRSGDDIVINTTYGTYKYKVSNIATEPSNSNAIYTIQKDKERLIIYTTDEANMIFVVYADLV